MHVHLSDRHVLPSDMHVVWQEALEVLKEEGLYFQVIMDGDYESSHLQPH